VRHGVFINGKRMVYRPLRYFLSFMFQITAAERMMSEVCGALAQRRRRRQNSRVGVR